MRNAILIAAFSTSLLTAAHAQDTGSGGPEICQWLEAGYPKAGTDDIQALTDKLVSAGPKKTEYETQAKFEERRDNALANILPTDKHVWVGQLLNKDVGQYSADAETFHYTESDLTRGFDTIEVTFANDDTYENKHVGMIRSVKVQRRGYQRQQDALGISAVVAIDESRSYEVGFTEKAHFLSSQGPSVLKSPLEVRFSMEAALAQRTRPFLQLRIGGEVTGEVALDIRHGSATLGDPSEITEYHRMLILKNACGVIYDTINSRPLASFAWPTDQ